MSAHNRAVRADIRLSRDDAGRAYSDQAILIVDPKAGRQFFALRKSGFRSLLPLGWGAGKAIDGPQASPVTIGTDDPLGGTDLRAMEMFPFWDFDHNTSFISDDTRLEKTVTMYAPEGNAYKLFVITFDKARMVPLGIKYYQVAMNNMVRLRRNSDFTMVGSRLRPRNIAIKDFTENTSTTLHLDWKLLEAVPSGIMDEGAFHKTTLDWPDKAD
jgi:hypothetical protein